MPHGHQRFSHRFSEAVGACSIPVIIADGLTRPFDDGGELTAAPFPRKYTFLLCGRATHAVRRRIADIIAGDPTLDAATVTYFGQDWRSRLNEATYVVAPRGYGRSSFFLYECLAAGALPIYVYDDEPWLPYALPVDVVRVDALGDVMRRLLDAPRAPDDLAARRAAALAAAPHLSFDGLWTHVADFFGGRGPLRCRPRPAATQTPPSSPGNSAFMTPHSWFAVRVRSETARDGDFARARSAVALWCATNRRCATFSDCCLCSRSVRSSSSAVPPLEVLNARSSAASSG